MTSAVRLTRLSKEMAARGLCSRREADKYIEQGWVLVDGEVIDALGSKILSSQKITLKNQAQQQQDQRVTLILNKPLGYVSNLPEVGYLPATTLIIPENYVGEADLNTEIGYHGLAPAGRLDIDSQGLLVLTQDGRIARQLIGANSNIEKEYLVWVSEVIEPPALAKLRFGLHLDGQALQPARVKKIDDHHLSIILTQGRKRQIRRMCELVHLQVERLMRVRIGKVRLGKLPPGKWRYLGDKERF